MPTPNFAIKEAYVSVQAPVGNGLAFKLGVWTGLLGYDVLEAGSNPNFSRSFGFFLEPTIHTGLLAGYKVNDVLSVAGGVTERGDNNAINLRSGVESLKSWFTTKRTSAPQSARPRPITLPAKPPLRRAV